MSALRQPGPRRGFIPLSQLRAEMPKQAVCRECNKEFVPGGPDTMDHHCETCGWVFLCSTCFGEHSAPDDIIGFAQWLIANKKRLHVEDCHSIASAW